jgi:DNA invertase Pin-like site-specific DNA recombinase
MKKQAIGIIRVSTAIQDMERQRRDIAQAARVHDLTILRTLELPDLSGTKMLRNPEVQRVLDSLAKPGVDGCVVSAIDRLIRPGELGDLAIFDSFQRSKKLIWTPAQSLDVSTQSGFLMSGVMGIIAGVERMILLQRTAAGKETCRLRGGNPNGYITVPRGLSFSKATGWQYVEPDASRIRKAYDLLFERKSWNQIAVAIGGSWTYNGVRITLKNSVWKGIRTYTIGREESLEVPMLGITEPLISPERWAAAQVLIGEKCSSWKARRKPPRFLLSGLISCGRCGKPWYVRMGGPGRHHYYCSSMFPGRGPSCGQRSQQRVATDNAVSDIVTSQFVSVGFLRAVLDRLQNARPTGSEDLNKLARVRGKLEAERRRLLQLVLKGLANEADLERESKRIDGELKDLDKLTPAHAAPAFDVFELAKGIARTFSQFTEMPFESRRTMLRDVCRRVTVLDGAVTAFTLSSTFLDRVNKSPRSRTHSTIRSRTMRAR